jgi:hypothetical protein
MNTIEVPMMKEMFMGSLLRSVGERCEEGKELKKYLNRTLTCEYSSPIGPLTMEQTKLQQRRLKFLNGPMKYEDFQEYIRSG